MNPDDVLQLRVNPDDALLMVHETRGEAFRVGGFGDVSRMNRWTISRMLMGPSSSSAAAAPRLLVRVLVLRLVRVGGDAAFR